MKKLKLMAVLTCIFMVNVASMCSSDSSDDNSSSSSITTTQVTNSVTNGNWAVTLYNENGANHTTHFSGYAFTFASNGTLSAVGSSNQSGSWSTYRDSNKTKMDLTFGATDGPFESITDDWDVLSATSTKVELKHTSGGDGSIDYLTFEKI